MKSIATIVLCSFFGLLFGNVVAGDVDEHPNVLLVIADDASCGSFGIYGSSYINTPNFDNLGEKGVMFTNAYTCNPKCAPSRACLLTGRYSWQLEESCNHNPFMSEKWEFFPYLLEDEGYEIGGTGKGWGPGVWNGHSCYANNDNPAGYLDNSIKLSPPYDGVSNIDYAANFERFLAQRDHTKPFCFWLGTHEPHRNYEKDSWKKAHKDLSKISVPSCFPDNETVRGDLADYALEVEWFDIQLGEAVNALKKEGVYDNTIIIVTSDHGMPFPHIKGQIYDDSFHVPLIVFWGEKLTGGRKISDYVNFPDIAPTLMDLLGMKRGAQMTGESFVRQLESHKSGRIDAKRNYALVGKERHDIGRTDGENLSVGYPVRAIRTDEFLYIRNFKPNRWPAGDPEYGYLNCDNSPTKNFILENVSDSFESKYHDISFGKRSVEELYDIQNDIDCVNNLSDNPDYAKVKQKLWKKLKQKLKAQMDPRIVGKGDIFDFYPNCKIEKQRELYHQPNYDPIKIFEEYEKAVN